MAKKIKVEETQVANEEKVETPKASKNSVTVLLENGTERVFSLEQHGENFDKLAESLVAKLPNKRSIKN